MTIIVEDGTGLSNANAYCAVAFADTFATFLGDPYWPGATTGAKEAAIGRATLFVDAFLWIGTRVNGSQSLMWPRTGVIQPDGTVTASNIVPQPVAQSCAIAAFKEVATPGILSPDLARGGLVARQSVGPISVDYRADAPAETLWLQIARLLRPFVRNMNPGLKASVTFGTDTTVPLYTPARFNPVTGDFFPVPGVYPTLYGWS